MQHFFLKNMFAGIHTWFYLQGQNAQCIRKCVTFDRYSGTQNLFASIVPAEKELCLYA
jgi:hypothetical protein